MLVGYASSAAIIWQAAAAAGASAQQIAGWMTALGIGMGVSTLALSWWYKAPVLTAWSTPGAALLATSLHGVTLAETIGVFIFANALILLCGVTGLFARLMKLIPHSLAAAMLAGVLLQFGLHAFAHLEGHFLLCGSMIAAWLIAKALSPRYAIVVTLLVGGMVAWVGGDVVTDKLTLSLVMPEFIAPAFTFTSLVSIGLPFFLVTMASQNAPGFATIKASGYPLAVSPLIIVTGGMALLFSPFGVFSICIAAITAAICQSPDAHPDAGKRWLAAGGGWPVLSAGGNFWRLDYRADGRPAAQLDPDAGRSGAAGHHQREFISGAESRSGARRGYRHISDDRKRRDNPGHRFGILGAGAGRGMLRPVFTRSPRVAAKASCPSRCESGC